MAMLLTRAKRRFHALGVDSSREAVAAARAALYHPDSARDLPPALLDRFCEKDGELLRVRAELAHKVEFSQVDLVRRTPRGPFDLILFKNVLLYLGAPAGEEVAVRLAAELSDGGLLFAASSEAARLRRAGLTAVRVGARVTAFARPGAEPRSRS